MACRDRADLWVVPGPGKTVGPDILRDSFPMQPDLLGNRLERPALPCQVADLLIAHTPVGVAQGHPFGGWQEGGRWGRRGRRRRLDDRWLVRECQGEHRGRHVDIL